VQHQRKWSRGFRPSCSSLLGPVLVWPLVLAWAYPVLMIEEKTQVKTRERIEEVGIHLDPGE
jgi:hypothetical protein